MFEQIAETAAPEVAPEVQAPVEAPPGEEWEPVVDHYAAVASELGAEAEPPQTGEVPPVISPADGTTPLEAGEGEAEWEISPEWESGYRQAMETFGIVEPTSPQPGEPGYEDYVASEYEQLRERSAQQIEELAALTGRNQYEIAALIDSQMSEWREQRQTEQQAQVEAQLAEYADGQEFAEGQIVGMAAEIGAEEFVDPGRVMSTIQQTYADISNQFGSEVARQYAEKIYRESVRAEAARMEQLAARGIEVARDAAYHLQTAHGDGVDPLAVLAKADAIAARVSARHNGDVEGAVHEIFRRAVDEVAGPPQTAAQLTRRYSKEGTRLWREMNANPDQRPAPTPAAEPTPEFHSPSEVIDHYSKRARALAKEA